MPDELWYLAYGSNLLGARLQRYLDRCDEVRGPAAARAVRLPHQLFFAHESGVWTGGTAFVDPRVDRGAGTLATAWLLGIDQFRTVVAGENGRPEPPDLSAVPMRPGDAVQVDSRRYGLLVGCESPDDRPACTITTPERPLPDPTVPTDAYVDTIVAGLAEGHALEEAEARAYLRALGAPA